MIKTRTVLLVTMILGCVLTSACGKQAGSSTGNGFADSEWEENSIAEIEPDFDYVYQTDDQPDRSTANICTENGIYTMVQTNGVNAEMSGRMLMFYDYEADCTVPVCSKPDCGHNNTDCNAYFPQQVYPVGEIYFYEDHLFILKETDGYHSMEQISLDGAERKNSCRLYRTATDTYVDDGGVIVTSNEYPRIILHRGYAYFSTYYPGNKECGLYRVKLGNDENAELLCMQEKKRPMLYRLKGYGRYVFFQNGNWLDEEGTSLDISLYAWDTVENKVIKVIKDVVRNYTVGGNYLYYFDLENLDSVMQYNLLTGECRMILDSGGQEAPLETQIFVRDGKLYYSTSSFQKVFDEEGNLEATLKGDDMISPY